MMLLEWNVGGQCFNVVGTIHIAITIKQVKCWRGIMIFQQTNISQGDPYFLDYFKEKEKGKKKMCKMKS